MVYQSSIINKIANYIEQMPESRQKALLQVLEKEALVRKVKAFDASVKKNDVTMADIVSIVRGVRKKRYNAGKQVRH